MANVLGVLMLKGQFERIEQINKSINKSINTPLGDNWHFPNR